ncbi:MAG: cupin [Planctomyces sp.]|nr:cupin [Planctomyces sp.]MDP7276740.1 cupin domain-containing protein [Planctomycetaceae bacterium]
MAEFERCIIDPGSLPSWEAPDGSRRVQGLISAESCGAEDLAAGLWWLHPGEECEPDVHPDASELYYVVSGQGVLRLGDEKYEVRAGMTIYIPMGVEHQTCNTGDEDLCYYWAFAPPPSGPSKAEEQGWKQVS